MSKRTKFSLTIFPTRTTWETVRSCLVMSVLLVLAVGSVVFANFEAKLLNLFAASFSAFGIVCLAIADARMLGTLEARESITTSRPEKDNDGTAVEPSEQSHQHADADRLPAGTWFRLLGHGVLIAGATYLIAGVVRM